MRLNIETGYVVVAFRHLEDSEPEDNAIEILIIKGDDYQTAVVAECDLKAMIDRGIYLEHSHEHLINKVYAATEGM